MANCSHVVPIQLCWINAVVMLVGGIMAGLADPQCGPDMLVSLFDRNNPNRMSNAYLALLMARYTYPTAFGIQSNTNLTRGTYQELYRRKWTALGAKQGSIQFIDAENSFSSFLMNEPKAHAVVFPTVDDVFVSFRGITNVDAALSENSRFGPVNGTFSNQKVPVHGEVLNCTHQRQWTLM